MKSVRCDLIFIFIELSEIPNSFLKIDLLPEMKNLVIFIKTRFYWKRVCTEMRKHAEVFHAKKGYKLAIVVFTPTSLFSK